MAPTTRFLANAAKADSIVRVEPLLRLEQADRTSLNEVIEIDSPALSRRRLILRAIRRTKARCSLQARSSGATRTV